MNRLVKFAEIFLSVESNWGNAAKSPLSAEKTINSKRISETHNVLNKREQNEENDPDIGNLGDFGNGQHGFRPAV